MTLTTTRALLDAKGIDDLKPCPFCGYTAFVIFDGALHWAQCEEFECGAEGPPHEAKENAITAWNRRMSEAK